MVPVDWRAKRAGVELAAMAAVAEARTKIAENLITAVEFVVCEIGKIELN